MSVWLPGKALLSSWIVGQFLRLSAGKVIISMHCHAVAYPTPFTAIARVKRGGQRGVLGQLQSPAIPVAAGRAPAASGPGTHGLGGTADRSPSRNVTHPQGVRQRERGG